MSKVRLSVIIVTYNRCKDLEECLDSLLNLNYPRSEIIVVDSNSTDGTRELVGEYSVEYINIAEKSMVKARNIGALHAKGEVVAYIDDDVIVSRDWAKYILEPYVDEDVAGVVGRVVSHDGEKEVYVPSKHKEVGKVFSNGTILGNFDIPTQHPIEVDTLIGCNMTFRRKLLQRIGGFDENFRGSCFRDDTDISLRLKKIGFKLIYHPKALVWHKFKGKTVDKKWFYWTLHNHTYFYIKNFPPMTLQKVIGYLFATFFPPQDYVKKTGIRIKPTPLSVTYAIAGLFSAVWVHRKGNPALIEKILQID